MRIGIVAWWLNRGQGVVGRQLRSALDQLGHETFVLARGWKPGHRWPATTRGDDVWAQPGVTPASGFEIPGREYADWIARNGIDAAFFDQNYQFKEIQALRRQGVKTIGRFVWERFAPEHVNRAVKAYDVVYSLTRCEQARYRRMGLESPYVAWGCHPELFAVVPRRDPNVVRFHYHAGLLGPRNPIREILDAFARTRNPGLRLLVKAQVDRHGDLLASAARRDPRIELVIADLPTPEHLQLFADSHVCLAPARWEGLGVHLFEAIAFGMPIVTNDAPPMTEVVTDGVNGLLVRGHRSGVTPSGIATYAPDVADLARAIEQLADVALRERLARGARETARQRSWSQTVADLRELLAATGSRVRPGATRWSRLSLSMRRLFSPVLPSTAHLA